MWNPDDLARLVQKENVTRDERILPHATQLRPHRLVSRIGEREEGVRYQP